MEKYRVILIFKVILKKGLDSYIINPGLFFLLKEWNRVNSKIIKHKNSIIQH